MACFLNFASYNMRGFQQGQYMVKDLCETQDIISVQEHWLSDSNLQQLVDLHTDFTVIAKSAMTERVQCGFLRGRPFGGLAVLARKSVLGSLTMIGVQSTCRCLAVSTKLPSGHIILIVNVYLPCSLFNW